MAASMAGELPQKEKETTGRRSSMPFVWAGLVVVALIAGWVARGLVVHPADAPTITVFKNWQLICPAPTADKGMCTLSTNVSDPKSGGMVLRFVVSADKDKRRLAVAAPFNVLLQPGLGLKLDGGTMQTFPYSTCNESGCISSVSPDAKTYDGILAAKKIEIFYENLNTKTSGWALPMDGYGDAVAAMHEAEAYRHSWLRRVLL